VRQYSLYDANPTFCVTRPSYPRALSQGSKSTVIRVEYFVRDTNYAYGVHICRRMPRGIKVNSFN
jgi:hypothetical protein